MKIRAHITAVSSNGFTITASAKGCEVAAGEYGEQHDMIFRVRNTPSSRKALRIGRDIVVTIEAK